MAFSRVPVGHSDPTGIVGAARVSWFLEATLKASWGLRLKCGSEAMVKAQGPLANRRDLTSHCRSDARVEHRARGQCNVRLMGSRQTEHPWDYRVPRRCHRQSTDAPHSSHTQTPLMHGSTSQHCPRIRWGPASRQAWLETPACARYDLTEIG